MGGPGHQGGLLRQVGALPYRRPKKSPIEVLLVTSRRTRRWIIPKGHVDAGRDDRAMARLEALEEAGVEGKIIKKSIGAYDYLKYYQDGRIVPATVAVYALAVRRERNTWPEMGMRERRWVSLFEASEMVEEPGLAALILSFGAVGEGA